MKKILILSGALIAFVGLAYGLKLWVAPLAELSNRNPKMVRAQNLTERLRFSQSHPTAANQIPFSNAAAPAPHATESDNLQTGRTQFEDPEALMQFADYLEPKLDVAEENLPLARELFTELENCIANGPQKGGTAVQAMCLSGAEELSDMHPELEPKFEDLKRKAPANVVSLMDGDEIVE